MRIHSVTSEGGRERGEGGCLLGSGQAVGQRLSAGTERPAAGDAGCHKGGAPHPPHASINSEGMISESSMRQKNVFQFGCADVSFFFCVKKVADPPLNEPRCCSSAF